MRLAQISRKLQVKPTEILAYIEKDLGKKIEPSPNTLIPAQFLESIYAHFSPTLEVVEEQTKELTEEEIMDESSLNIEDGIIRAPKVKVEGIKVVGKIALPEKKVKEEEVESTEEGEEKEDSAEVKETENSKPVRSRGKSNSKNRKRGSRQKEEVSYEDKKSREIKKRQEELNKQRELKKKRGKEFYESKMKEIQTTQTKVNDKKKITSRKTSSDKIKKEKPKSLWGKFKYWLNDQG